MLGSNCVLGIDIEVIKLRGLLLQLESGRSLMLVMRAGNSNRGSNTNDLGSLLLIAFKRLVVVTLYY